MIKITQLCAAFALTAVFANSASAVLVDAVFDRVDNTTTAPGATINEILDTIGSSAGPTALLGYTITGLTIDAIGVADDSITFEIQLSATGSTASGAAAIGMGFSSGNIGVNSENITTPPVSDDASEFDAVGESITFSLASSSATLGSGVSETASANFLGFTGFNLQAFTSSAGDLFDLSGGTTADDVGLDTAADPASFDPAQTFTLAYNAGNGFRVFEIGVLFDPTVTTVPEPSTAGLCCLGAIGWVARRRRS